jgi:ribosomal protein L33
LYELYKIRKYNLIGGMQMRVQVILECTETKLRHYTTTKNKKTHPERLEMMKYNPVLKKHTLYKETKK